MPPLDHWGKVRTDAGYPRLAGPHFTPPGAFVITFGKHRGKTLAQVPENYVVWLADKAQRLMVRLAAKRFLGIDGHGEDAEPDDLQTAEPDRESAAVRLPLVVWEHERMMADRFGTDPNSEAGRVVLWCRDALRDLCSLTTGRRFLRPDEEAA